MGENPGSNVKQSFDRNLESIILTKDPLSNLRKPSQRCQGQMLGIMIKGGVAGGQDTVHNDISFRSHGHIGA